MKIKTIGPVLIVLALVATFAYAFDEVTPTEAFNMATTDPDVYILDVRTSEEWKWVGHPGPNRLGEGILLEGKVLNIPIFFWKHNQWVQNAAFLNRVKRAFEDNPNVILITMCRSGGRAGYAAGVLEAEGYQVYNMATGFQGDRDPRGYRVVNGWLNDGLPYTDAGAGYKK